MVRAKQSASWLILIKKWTVTRVRLWKIHVTGPFSPWGQTYMGAKLWLGFLVSVESGITWLQDSAEVGLGSLLLCPISLVHPGSSMPRMVPSTWRMISQYLCYLWADPSQNRDDFTKGHLSSWAPLEAQTVKNLSSMWKTQVWSRGWEDPMEKRMATHSSILWRIS